MKTQNKTNQAPQNPSAEALACEQSLAHYAALSKKLQELNKAMELDINEIILQYAPEMATLKEAKQKTHEHIRQFCLTHKKALFSKKRSIGTPHGVIGYRLGTPRLKTKDNSNWEQVLARLQEQLPQYVRTVQQPAKNQILAQRHAEHLAPLLQALGLEIVQEALFYIDPSKAA